MSSLSPKDRASLCSFTFSDGRRCRTPRTGKQSHFCFDHAQKETRARAADNLGKDLAYFFSGDYLSACDLSTALGRLIPAVLRGDVKPRAARTVAYLAQTLLQAIHVSQDEYINAFGTDTWRKSIRNSVNSSYNYLCPPAPKPEQPESLQPQPQPAAAATVAHPACPERDRRVRGEAVSSSHPQPQQPKSQQPAQPQTQPPQPARSPHAPLPRTGAEFVQHVLAGLPTSSLPATLHVQPAPPNPQPAETPKASAAPPNNPPSARPSTPPKPTPSSPSAPLTPTGPTSPAPPQPQAQPHASPSACPEQGRRVNPREPNRDAPWLHFSSTSNIPPDSKLL